MYIFQSGVGAAINGGFSHRRSVLADMNAPRNPLRNMYQPSDCLKTQQHFVENPPRYQLH